MIIEENVPSVQHGHPKPMDCRLHRERGLESIQITKGAGVEWLRAFRVK